MISDILELVARREALTAEEAAFAFTALFEGTLSPEQIGALMLGLRTKGETPLEIAAAVTAMRARMIPANVRADAIDVCGTGGDGAQTLNISTSVAIVLAACGVPVAKHGNRAASSLSGATDVLGALGVKTDAPQVVVERCVNELGIGYFAAPLYHPALAALVPVRKSLGVRTLFNLLGPMCNPARVTTQMIGVPNMRVINAFVDVLMNTGSTHGLIVCGAGPIDEFSLAGTNYFRTFKHQDVSDTSTIDSAHLGLMSAPIDAIKGGTAEENARDLLKLLSGMKGAYRDTVLLNAAHALHLVRGTAVSENIALASDAIDQGHARTLLDAWVRMSNQS